MSRTPVHLRPPRVYLTGFMGSGKSTIGPVLANTLGYSFVDLDQVIETTSGAAIAALFRERGEAAFRRIECAALIRASEEERVVVALGGGAVSDPETLAHARATGVLVYLQLSLDEILERVKRNTDRPLLLLPDGMPLRDEALRERARALFASREPVYLTADVVVNASGGDLGRTVDAVARGLSPFLPR